MSPQNENESRSRLERPLPATPPSPHIQSNTLNKSPKRKDRNRLRKSSLNPLQKSLERLTLASVSSRTTAILHSPISKASNSNSRQASRSSDVSFKSSPSKEKSPNRIVSAHFGDPDITPKPLNIHKSSGSNQQNSRQSHDSDGGNVLNSRWSTSTSDAASAIVARKESKRTIFGIPISFKRRAKSEQIPTSVKISSGFFGGMFGGSKLDIMLPSAVGTHDEDTNPVWQSARASSQLTAGDRGERISEDSTKMRSFEQKFLSSREKEKENSTLKGRAPQRRHTLTGSLIGMGKSLSGSIFTNRMSPRSSVHSSNHSAKSDEKKKTTGKVLLSLFPKPPKRNSSDVMSMVSKNATMPLIIEGSESRNDNIRATSNPFPSNFSIDRHSKSRQQGTVAYQYNGFVDPRPYYTGFSSASTPNVLYPPPRRVVSEFVDFNVPKSAIYDKVQKKPALTYLDLKVTSDIESMDAGEVIDTWAVVELTGKISNNKDVFGSSVHGLDIVFLLDLTQNMSEQSLKNLRSTIECILENISGTKSDSFGIAAFTSTSACEVLMHMVPCSHQAKHRAFSLLEQIRMTSEPCRFDSSIADVVRSACSMFMAGMYKQNKHLIILSSAIPSIQHQMVDIRGFEEVTVHVISVSCVYWPKSEVVYTDRGDNNCGFCFPTASMDVTGLDIVHAERMPTQARRFIRALRSEQNIGMLKDLEIHIEAGPNARIKNILGSTKIATLRPYERATLLVRLEVFHPHKTTRSDSGDERESLEETLYATLGMNCANIITASVSYTHSLLPENTRSATTAAAEVKINSSYSVWNPSTPSLHSLCEGIPNLTAAALLNLRRRFVRKALIQKVVSDQRSPKDALVSIEHIALNLEEKDLDYFDVVRELRYQMRVWNGRREGMLLSFGRGDNSLMTLAEAIKINRDDDFVNMNRSFSFQSGKRTESFGTHIHTDRDGLPTPALTNDSVSGESLGYPSSPTAKMRLTEDGSDGSVRRIMVDDGYGSLDNSPITVVEAEPLKSMQPIDSATRLWKRIERAGEVGSVGESSIGTIDTTAITTGGESSVTEGDGASKTNKEKKKKRKNKKKRRKNMVNVAGTIQPTEI